MTQCGKYSPIYFSIWTFSEWNGDMTALIARSYHAQALLGTSNVGNDDFFERGCTENVCKNWSHHDQLSKANLERAFQLRHLNEKRVKSERSLNWITGQHKSKYYYWFVVVTLVVVKSYISEQKKKKNKNLWF